MTDPDVQVEGDEAVSADVEATDEDNGGEGAVEAGDSGDAE